MKFSKRTEWNIEESELSQAHRERLAAGIPIADLTASNPTRCGFIYPEDLLEPLGVSEALVYDPNPKGLPFARGAVCRYYAGHGARLDVGRIVLTTSTSEAYSYLLKLLCNPGDSILIPQPSYPLFDFLADVEVVKLTPAHLVYDHGWQIDFEDLRRRITETTRAVVLVHPNNPTGHFTKSHEATELASICRERGLALIVDEVFLDYRLDTEVGSSNRDELSFAGMNLDCLAFVVSGISKICGLPQMKAAWLVAVGPGADEALKRLEVIADTYLSMNAPVQNALPVWLAARGGMQDQIRKRVDSNLMKLDRALAMQTGSKRLVNRLLVEGGWYAVLRIPAMRSDEETAIELVDRGVWVHPGYFFGMGRSGWLVVSLLAESQEFLKGISLLLAQIQENQHSYL
jgi:alanine-synthesizing transaminase